jgi:hypothetical protein
MRARRAKMVGFIGQSYEPHPLSPLHKQGGERKLTYSHPDYRHIIYLVTLPPPRLK